MDFFERQEIAHKKTGRLIVLFAIAVIMIVCAMNLVTLMLLRWADNTRSVRHYRFNELVLQDRSPIANQPEPYIGVTLITLGIITCGSMYKIAMLSHGGGAAVAQLMGGRPIAGHSSAPAESTLQNIVEEMSIASGVPVPQIFVMDDEEGINAFAAGFSPADAVVCVTRGCLTHLSRDELQGVIAHEFSHILNGDMRMNLRLMGVLNGILVIGLGGYILMRSVQFVGGRRSSRDDSGQIVLAILAFGIAMFVIGYVGVFFGRLIQAAVSRQREYLADASAVQFTRNPMGLAGALKKIAATGSTINNPHAMETAHLFFAPGLTSLFATHPPIEERIKLLDPTFAGSVPSGSESEIPQSASPVSMLSNASRSMPAANIVDRAGATTPHAVNAAAKILASIPPTIMQAVRDPFSARAAALAMLLSDDQSVRVKQIEFLNAQIDRATVDAATKLSPIMQTQDDSSHVALMDLVQPAIRRLSPAQLQQFALAAKSLIEADGRVTLFEYAMSRQLRRYLVAGDQSKQPAPIANSSTQSVLNPIITVLTALSNNGNDAATAAQAFRAGVERLELSQQISPASDSSLKAVDVALNQLADASPGVKRSVVDAAAHAVAADGIIQAEEAALLRAICAALDVPLPAGD